MMPYGIRSRGAIEEAQYNTEVMIWQLAHFLRFPELALDLKPPNNTPVRAPTGCLNR